MTVLMVILTFIVVISIGVIISKIRDKKLLEAGKTLDPQSYAVFSKNSVFTPKGIYFAQNHSWMQLEKDGSAKVGIDDFLQKIFGVFRINKVASVGQLINKGDEIAEIEINGKTLKIKSPIDGKVISQNHEVIVDSNIIHENPYENGWIVNLAPVNLKENLRSLFIGKDVIDWKNNEVVRFKDFLATLSPTLKPIGVTLYDGGNINEGVVAELDSENFKKFEKDFLSL